MTPTLLLGTALLLAAPALKESPKKADIVGEWEVESVNSGNPAKPRPKGKGPGPQRYVFTADGKWFLFRGERKVGEDRAFIANPKADPPAIDLRYDPVDQEGRTVLGIYKVEGDKLTLCLSRGEGTRPAGFESTADVPATIYILKRVKPKD
jgi:uncharacterized protein (TIGR03067 family)